jgi:UPF0176 protein
VILAGLICARLASLSAAHQFFIMAAALTSASSAHQENLTTIILYYKYISIPENELVSLQLSLTQKCQEFSLLGRIRLSSEGVNGTLGGTAEHINRFIEFSNASKYFSGISYKFSNCPASSPPFHQLTISQTAEVTATGAMKNVDLEQSKATHLSPEQFHAEVVTALNSADKNTVILDVRNHYETAIGQFSSAIDPKIRCFSQFPAYVEANQAYFSSKKVLMYCTGGVRCEKAAAFMQQRCGVAQVYQLTGGIHKYIQEYGEEGMFKGKNFVFDARGSMGVAEEGKIREETPESSEMKQSPNDCSERFGRCVGCTTPSIEQNESLICSVCAALVLLCSSCHSSLLQSHQPLLCIEHLLEANDSSLEQRQIDYLQRHSSPKLLELCEKLSYNIEAAQSSTRGRSHRNRRKQLAKQLLTLSKELQRRGVNYQQKVADKPDHSKEESKNEGNDGGEKNDPMKNPLYGYKRKRNKRKIIPSNAKHFSQPIEYAPLLNL